MRHKDSILDKSITIRVNNIMLESIETYCENKFITPSNLIRVAINNFILQRNNKGVTKNPFSQDITGGSSW